VSQTLSAFEEHVTGELLEITITAAATRAGATARHFAVGPVLNPFTGAIGDHQYPINTSGGAIELTAAVDASRSEQSYYRDKRADDVVTASPVVTTSSAGTYAAWMNAQGKPGRQNTVERVATPQQLNDIAELAKRTDRTFPSPEAEERATSLTGRKHPARPLCSSRWPICPVSRQPLPAQASGVRNRRSGCSVSDSDGPASIANPDTASLDQRRPPRCCRSSRPHYKTCYKQSQVDSVCPTLWVAPKARAETPWPGELSLAGVPTSW